MVNLNERKINPLRFSVHGISVAVHSNDADWLARFRKDFAFFPCEEKTPEVSLALLMQKPRFDRLPDEPASQVFPECVVYGKNKERFIDYHGQALLQESEDSAVLETEDGNLAHELAFLYVLSKVGTKLDKQGIHRVHALGFVKNGEAALVLIPSGGGKSTLATSLLEAAEKEGIKLLSDDSPLIDRKGRALPFPLRLAYRGDSLLPEEWEKEVETLKRRKYGEKKLVPISALAESVRPKETDRFPVRTIVLAERHGSRRKPKLVRANKREVLATLNRDLVVGLGLPQIAELVLRKGILSLVALAPTAASRFFVANRLALGARGFRLKMSSDASANAAAILEALR